MTTPTTLSAPVGRILLENVRLSFAKDLTEASTIAGSDEKAAKFGCGLLLAPTHPQIKELITKMQAVALAQWKDKAPQMYAALQASNKLALHDGNTKPKYEGYPGMLFLSPSTPENKPPTLLHTVGGQNVVLTIEQARRRFYSGCYVNANLDLWAQDNQWGQRINAQLRGVQFLRDGDAFSAGGSSADAGEFGLAPEEGSDAGDFGAAAAAAAPAADGFAPWASAV
ncbi:MAG: hypothetical protein RLZZ524_2355 [Pseudomonadota bacterium]|jgi:hypothetical protein